MQQVTILLMNMSFRYSKEKNNPWTNKSKFFFLPFPFLDHRCSISTIQTRCGKFRFCTLISSVWVSRLFWTFSSIQLLQYSIGLLCGVRPLTISGSFLRCGNLKKKIESKKKKIKMLQNIKSFDLPQARTAELPEHFYRKLSSLSITLIKNDFFLLASETSLWIFDFNANVRFQASISTVSQICTTVKNVIGVTPLKLFQRTHKQKPRLEWQIWLSNCNHWQCSRWPPFLCDQG